MSILNWITFFLGFPALLLGADFLVKSASAIASRFGVPRVIIGLTIVAFGTSAPELLISVQSALANQASMAIGNVVGSNIANILLIMGIAALFRTFITNKIIPQKDLIFFMISMITLILLLLFPIYGKLSAIISLILFAYIMYNSWKSAKDSKETLPPPSDQEENPQPFLLLIIYLISGSIGLALGANWLVSGGQKIALMLHISPAVIGLIFFAVGTSLPEIATSVYAARKNEFGLALGNIIGSNIFNGLLILPAAGLIQNIHAEKLVQFRDLPFMFISSLILSYIIYKGLKITKFGGMLLLALYTIWIILVTLTATNI